jgi:hypothetical protein
MRYADLSSSKQILLVSIIIFVCGALLTRVIIFMRRERAGIKILYPRGWTEAQRQTLEGFRLLIGLAVMALWSAYVWLAPFMPTNWPFGYLEAVSLIALILLSYAWVLLLAPRSWKALGAYSFWTTLTLLVALWGTILIATGWMLIAASAAPPHFPMPLNGVFA